MDIPEPIAVEIGTRVARVTGQLGGIQRMLGESRDCRDVVYQMRAAERALERARLRLVAAGLRYCAGDPDRADDLDELETLLVHSS